MYYELYCKMINCRCRLRQSVSRISQKKTKLIPFPCFVVVVYRFERCNLKRKQMRIYICHGFSADNNRDSDDIPLHKRRLNKTENAHIRI